MKKTLVVVITSAKYDNEIHDIGCNYYKTNNVMDHKWKFESTSGDIENDYLGEMRGYNSDLCHDNGGIPNFDNMSHKEVNDMYGKFTYKIHSCCNK